MVTLLPGDSHRRKHEEYHQKRQKHASIGCKAKDLWAKRRRKDEEEGITVAKSDMMWQGSSIRSEERDNILERERNELKYIV